MNNPEKFWLMAFILFSPGFWYARGDKNSIVMLFLLALFAVLFMLY